MEESKIQSLKESLYAAYSLSNAKIDSNDKDSTNCGSYNINPFHSSWDEKTVKEVSESVKIYLDTWIIPGIEKALGVPELRLRVNGAKSELVQLEKQLAEFSFDTTKAEKA